MAPLGFPVVPAVYWIWQRSSKPQWAGRIPAGGSPNASQAVSSGPCPADHDHVRERRDRVPDGPHHLDPARVRDHGHGPRVVDRVEELSLPVDDVGRDRDGADPPAGEVADQVLGRGVQVDADPVPFPDAEPEQARADAVRLGPERGVGVLDPPGRVDERDPGLGDRAGVEEDGDVRHRLRQRSVERAI